MNELQTSNMKTPIEIALGVDENGMTTAKALYEFLSGEKSNFSKWAKRNIEQNEFYEENKDWWGFVTVTNGNECKDYRLTTDFAKHLSMESHSARGKEARQYFITIEDRAKQEVINRSQLSPQMQMVMQMAESMARQELEQKRQAEKVNRIEQTVSNMKDIFTKPIGDWKSEINGRIREISVKSGIGYQTLYGQLYGELETTAHCSLNMLQRNKINKMKKAGNNETAIKNGTTKIQIIYEKPQLKAIFEGIVKNYAMRYCS
jgi:anti-repressor protein|nr:MAG TPA: AntA/AntB antirepressor [Caudoviricetes sp.]DAW49868.1 MAG TPA: AntA/AntB antirepressor [Caudoviricetes sp.]